MARREPVEHLLGAQEDLARGTGLAQVVVGVRGVDDLPGATPRGEATDQARLRAVQVDDVGPQVGQGATQPAYGEQLADPAARSSGSSSLPGGTT
jgi:hypothetical protein